MTDAERGRTDCGKAQGTGIPEKRGRARNQRNLMRRNNPDCQEKMDVLNAYLNSEQQFFSLLFLYHDKNLGFSLSSFLFCIVSLEKRLR